MSHILLRLIDSTGLDPKAQSARVRVAANDTTMRSGGPRRIKTG